MNTRHFVLLASFLLFGHVVAGADIVPADFQQVLLPIAGTGIVPGAFGSQWTNDFWIFNNSSDKAVIFADTTNCQLAPSGSPCILTWSVPPNSQSHGDFQGGLPGDPPGLLLYIAKANAASATLNLRVQDVSRQAQTWGTQLPVVREQEFRVDRIEMVNVPLDERFRQTLRIYDPDAHEHVSFRVRIFDTTSAARGVDQSGGIMLVDAVLDAQPGRTYRANFPRVPSVAQLSNFVQGFPELRTADRVRIEVEPVTQGIRFWAFVSITNDETQHVTTITPQ